MSSWRTSPGPWPAVSQAKGGRLSASSTAWPTRRAKRPMKGSTCGPSVGRDPLSGGQVPGRRRLDEGTANAGADRIADDRGAGDSLPSDRNDPRSDRPLGIVRQSHRLGHGPEVYRHERGCRVDRDQQWRILRPLFQNRPIMTTLRLGVWDSRRINVDRADSRFHTPQIVWRPCTLISPRAKAATACG
jgi:hypothetical protein